jgi:hypothetical protein
VTRVCAKTITELTSSPAFQNAGQVPSSAPTAEQLAEKIRRRLQTEWQTQQDIALSAPRGKDRSRQESAAQNALRNLQRFNDMLQSVPEGFSLQPVYYASVTKKENEEAHREYIRHVRPRFFQFLAQNHAEELSRLGICAHGIGRMKNGLDPATEDGRYYQVNIDHVVERAGSGLWATQSVPDPDDAGNKGRLRVNHFGNLTLLIESVHEYKNALNEIQQVSSTPDGQGVWCLMMVPQRAENSSGFVCAPQKDAERHALRFRACDFERKISYAGFTVDQASSSINLLRQNPVIDAYFKKFYDGVWKAGAPANDNKPQEGLKNAFNRAAQDDAKIARALRVRVAPALEETRKHFTHVFNQASFHAGNNPKSREIDVFANIWHGRGVARLRAKLALLPLPEARTLKETFDNIDRDLKAKLAQVQAQRAAGQAAQHTQPAPGQRYPWTSPQKRRRKKRNGSRQRPPKAM